MKRAIVVFLAKTDEAIDQLLYRPAVVKAFSWLPRWWMCDLAKVSMALDDRWSLGWWDSIGIHRGGPCEACRRRASIHVYGGHAPGEPVYADYLEARPVYVCGWCQLHGPMSNEAEVQRELARARRDSVAWHWRWRVRPEQPSEDAG